MKNSIKDIHETLGTAGKKSKKKIAIISAVVLALIIVVFIIFGRNKDSNLPSYKTVEVEKGDIVVQVSATGTLEPTNSVEVGTELSGTVKEVYADYNSTVKKGQLLAVIDTAKLSAQAKQYNAALQASKASVMQAKATEKETQIKLNQLKKLWELTGGKSPSQTEIDAAEAAHDRAVANTASAEASVTQAQAALDAILTDLSKSEIRSPVNGVVLVKGIEAGQTVAASYSTPELFTIAEDLKKMELHVNVDEADIGQVKEGQKAQFTVDAYPNKIFEGIITQARFGSETVDNVVTYETVIQVDNSDLLLRPGMTATADITVKEQMNVIKLPTAALRYSPPVVTEDNTSFLSKLMPRPPKFGKTQPKEKDADTITVWVLENNTPMPYDIKLGDSDGSYKMMREGGLKVGMKLITGNATNGK